LGRNIRALELQYNISELEKERVKDALMKLKTPPHEELQPPRKINKWNKIGFELKF